MRPIAIFIFLLFTGQATTIFAEPPSLQIPAGKFIRIYTQDAETRITGRFQQAIKDSLIMTRTRGILGRKQRLSIALADISKLEVHLYHKSHVKKGGILGALAGGAGGLILVKGAETTGYGPGAEFAYFFLPSMFTLGGGLVGAFVGGLFSYHAWETIDFSPSVVAKDNGQLALRLSFRF